METHKQVGAWLQNQMTFVASVITVTGFVGSLVSYGGLATIFLFMLGGGLALIAVRLSSETHTAAGVGAVSGDARRDSRLPGPPGSCRAGPH